MNDYFVLFVDDDQEILEISKKLVLSFDNRFTIETASSVHEALQKLKEKEYEAIVSDYQMPELDGLDFLKIIREKRSNIPFIILTGRGREEIAIEALNLGASRYIQKGGSPRTLYTYLAKTIAQVISDWRVQQALEISEESYRLIVQSANDAIFLHARSERGATGTFLQVNNKLCEMLGYSNEELLRMAPKDILTKQFIEDESQEITYILNDEGNEIFETNFVTKERKVIPVEVNTQIIEVTDQEVILSIVRDLTERKEAERKIADHIDLTKRYLDIAEVMIVAISRDQIVTMINQKGCEILGWTEDQIIGKNWFDNFIPESDREEVKNVFQDIMIGNIQPFEYFENLIITKGGEEKNIAWSNSTIKDETGKILTTLSSGLDITDQKQATIQLEESEARFKTLFDDFPRPIFIWKREGTDFVLSSYNQASLKFTNEEVKKLIGIKLTEMYRNKPEIINDVFSTYETQMTLQKEMEYTFQSIENVIEMRVTYAFIPPDMILVYTEDITEEKEIERALKEEEAKNKEMYERTQTYLKLVGVMIVVLDRDFNISLINPKGCEILGYSEEELIGKDWLNYVPERIKADILKVRASEVVQTEEIIYHENLILTKEGKERTIGWSNSAHFDEQGEVLFYISSGEDITDKQQNNEKRIFLHRLLRHDVRNKAFIAQSFLDLLLETDLNEEQLTYVQKSKNAVKVTSDLVEKVKDLLNVVEEHEVFDLNLNNLLNKSILINKDLAEEKGIEIIPKIDNEIIVQAGGLLLKLLSNLVENAVKHSHGTMIEISTEITSSNEVKVKVDDNGIGIDPKIKELLFERNVKSKESTGSGLGLYLCKSIIEKYGGKIEFCDSALGGACFSITLMSDKINSRFT